MTTSIVPIDERGTNPVFAGSGERRTMTEDSAPSDGASVDHATPEELRHALDHNEFFLVYQPEIDLQSGAFAGVEALIRWRRDGGVAGPNVFLEGLESTGLIVPVGRWSLDTACRQGSRWHDRGYRFAVSVNVSNVQFDSPAFIRDVDTTLNESGFDPGLLVLEFSQRSLSGEPTSRVEALRELGVKVAVDDFLPGRSSWDDVTNAGVEIVKLDRTFIASMDTSPDSEQDVHELVALARAAGVQVVASGIEDDAQRRRLQFDDVSTGQGFHFSKPREAREIDRYLEDFSIFSGKPL